MKHGHEGCLNALIVIGGLLLTGWCVGRAQERRQDSLVFKGMTLPGHDQPFWKSCSELKPIPQASDGSASAVCTDIKGQKYDLIMRLVSKSCQSILPKTDDGYRHWICSEQDELMLKAQAREADTDKRRDLGVPAGDLQ